MILAGCMGAFCLFWVTGCFLCFCVCMFVAFDLLMTRYWDLGSRPCTMMILPVPWRLPISTTSLKILATALTTPMMTITMHYFLPKSAVNLEGPKNVELGRSTTLTRSPVECRGVVCVVHWAIPREHARNLLIKSEGRILKRRIVLQWFYSSRSSRKPSPK